MLRGALRRGVTARASLLASTPCTVRSAALGSHVLPNAACTLCAVPWGGRRAFSSGPSGLGDSLAISAANAKIPTISSVVEASRESLTAANGNVTDFMAASATEAASSLSMLKPTVWIESLLELVNSGTGLPWWATVAAGTFAIRFAAVPLFVMQMKNIETLKIVQPLLDATNKKYEKMDPEYRTNASLAGKYADEVGALMKAHKCHPLKSLTTLFVQAPLFVTFYLTLKNMVDSCESFKDGGIAWFTDLTAVDPYHVLPVITAATFLLNVELGMETQAATNQRQAAIMKNVFRGLAAMMIPFTWNFNAAIFMYWIPNNIFSLFQGRAIRLDPIRKAVGLPPMPAKAAPSGNARQQDVVIPQKLAQNKPRKNRTKKESI